MSEIVRARVEERLLKLRLGAVAQCVDGILSQAARSEPTHLDFLDQSRPVTRRCLGRRPRYSHGSRGRRGKLADQIAFYAKPQLLVIDELSSWLEGQPLNTWVESILVAFRGHFLVAFDTRSRPARASTDRGTTHSDDQPHDLLRRKAAAADRGGTCRRECLLDPVRIQARERQQLAAWAASGHGRPGEPWPYPLLRFRIPHGDLVNSGFWSKG